jgi:hypothetical protein
VIDPGDDDGESWTVITEHLSTNRELISAWRRSLR